MVRVRGVGSDGEVWGVMGKDGCTDDEHLALVV